MRLIYSSGSVELYVNRDYKGMTYMSSGIRSVSNLNRVITLAQRHELANQTISLGTLGPGNFSRGASKNKPEVETKADATLRQTSSSHFEVSTSSAGWVDVALPYKPGWKIGNTSSMETASGTMAWYLAAGRANAVFAPATQALIGDYFSLLVFLIGIGATCIVRRAKTKESQSD